jgi:predicted permease
MTTNSSWWRRLLGWRRQEELDRGLQEEFRFHLEQETARHVQSGVPLEEARRRAHVRFGGVEALRESTRDEFRPAFVQDFVRDMRIGTRMLFRRPGFAAVVILTIGLGAGASTAVFSVVNGVLLQPLPYPRPDQLVRLYQIDKDGIRRGNVSEPNFRDWQSSTRSFTAMARMALWGPTPVLGASEPTLATMTAVSREFFDVMGVKPAVGRTFAPPELVENGAPAMIVSHAFWRRWLEGTPDFGRRPLRISDRVFTVVGVMPEGFEYPNGTAIWFPAELNGSDKERTAHNFQAVGRLRDGASLEAARAELGVVSRELKVRYGDRTWMSDATAVPLLEQLTTASRPALRMLFGAAILLLAIAIMNVSSLLVARAAGRRHEFAIQLAIGAGKARLRRQLLAETAVLCLAGTALGALVAVWAVGALAALGPRSTPRLSQAHVDWFGLAFALGISLVATATLGLLTTIGAREAQLSTVLSTSTRTGTEGRRSLFARQALVVMQVALTLVLLAGTGLLAQSFMRLLAVNPGFRLDDALVVDLTLSNGGPDFRVRRIAAIDELLGRLRAMPGVTHAGMTSGFPLGGGNYSNGQYLEMTSADELPTGEHVRALGEAAKARRGEASYRIASGTYFQTMGIPLIKGRVFEDSDAIDAPHVAVISESLAKERWPDRDPIGRFIQFGNMDGDRRGFRVIGVVGDVRELPLEDPPDPILYGSYRQRPNSVWRVSLIVRGPEPGSVVGAVQRIVREVNPELPIVMRTVDGAFNAALADRRFSLLLISIFGVSALVLATLGLYALIAYVVQHRTREIGIRMALGATAGDVAGLVVGRGVVLAVIGCVAGLAGGLALTRVVQGLLFGVTPTDPTVLAAVLAITLAASIGATLLPARRATRASPVASLRG